MAHLFNVQEHPIVGRLIKIAGTQRGSLWTVPAAILLFCCLSVDSVFAQSTMGLPPFGSSQGFGLDSVNANNLNVNVNLPILHKSGRGLAANSSIAYNSTVWSLLYNSTTKVYSWGFANSWMNDGATAPFGTFSRTVVIVPPHNCNVTTWTYTDPAGTAHTFPGLTTGNGCGTPPPPPYYAIDGSGYVFTGNSVNPDYLYDQSGNNVMAGTSITDPNGNSLSGGAGLALIDTLGMTALSVSTQTNGSTKTYTYTYTGPNGPEPIVLTETQLQVASNFQCNNSVGKVTEFGPSAFFLPTSMSLPDGTEYVFKYEATPGESNYTTGRLSEIDLPTGGSVKYVYTPWSATSPMCTDGSPAALSRTTSDGAQWKYSRNTTGNGTTVTDPATNQTNYSFSWASTGFETKRVVNQGSSAPLETIVTCYNGNYANCASAVLEGYTEIIQRDIYTTPVNGKTALSETFYKNNLPTKDNEFDFGINTGSAPTGTPLQATITSYATPTSGSYVNNRPACIQVTSGSPQSTCGTITSDTVSVTINDYDALANGSVSLGNLTQTSNWVKGTSYLNRSFTYYSNGLLETATDVNSNPATTSYQNCNSTPAYVSSVSSGGLTTSYTWDCNGGVVTESSDANLQPTQIGYDLLWRVTSVTDPLGNVVNTKYSPVAGSNPSTVEKYLNFPTQSATSTVDTLFTLDGLGRTVESEKRTGPNATTFDNTVLYGYGWTAGVGPVTTQTVPNGTATTTTQMDALFRPASVTDGGGGTFVQTYSQNDVLNTLGPAPSGEHTKNRQLQFDGLGRITSVCEILSSGGSSCGQSVSASGYLTSYAYGVPAAGGSLLTVTQGVQTRTYVRDGLGRLISESNPESGTTNYAFDSDSSGACPGTYNADLVKRTDNAGNVTCYTYDVLHRQLSSTYTGPNPTTNRYFVYDSATVNGQNTTYAKGRIAEAYTATSSVGTKVTDEGFSYNADGQLANFYESTPNSAGYFSIPMTYWANGMIDTFGPFLTESQYKTTPDGEGRPLSISGGGSSAKSVAYNGASEPTQIETSCNGSTCYPIAYQYDPNTLRMTQYSAAMSNGTISGTLTWNPNGSLQQLVIVDPVNSADAQTCTYAADDLSRIASVSCGTTWAQTFSYDAFGNITKSGSISWAPGYNTTTNHYTLGGTSYDADGNILKDTFNTYTWDAEGKPLTTAYSGTEAYSFLYDAFGHKVESSINGTYSASYVNVGSFKLSAAGQAPGYSEYPFSGGGSLTSENGGLTGVQLGDWLGTVRAAISYTGGVIGQTGAHAPFGEPYSYTSGYPKDFTGQENDHYTNTTYYFPERQYRSSQGRWLSADPAGLSSVDLTNPQSWNRYAYVNNSPLNSVDPLGLACQPPASKAFCAWWNRTNGRQWFLGGDWTYLFEGWFECENEDCGWFQFPNVFDIAFSGGYPANNTAKSVFCSALPQGRVTSLNGSVGLVGGQQGSIQQVVNYNNGEVSNFFTGGLQAGWNGGASASVSVGFIADTKGQFNNSDFSGPFQNLSGSAPEGPAGSVSSSSNGVKIVQGGVGVNLIPGPTGNYSYSWTSSPMQGGNVWTNVFTPLGLFDLVTFGLRKAGGC